ncbi:hypothetical protein J2S09_004091 [Bacillus fengqiuensis]|nr:hypothetical protein [Bacillus fengqiuensis]
MTRLNAERNSMLNDNERFTHRDLIVQNQKRNLKYLKEVLGEINFITESVEIDQREIYSPVVKFVNHDKKVEKFNSLLTIMGLRNFRVTPRGKLRKLESILQNNVNRESNRRNQHISRIARVTPSDVKLLADLLSSRRQQITTYLNVIKDLEI